MSDNFVPNCRHEQEADRKFYHPNLHVHPRHVSLRNFVPSASNT